MNVLSQPLRQEYLGPMLDDAVDAELAVSAGEEAGVTGESFGRLRHGFAATLTRSRGAIEVFTTIVGDGYSSTLAYTEVGCQTEA